MRPAGPFTLEIDSVIVETEAERGRLETASPVVERAFTLLAARLARTPFHHFDEARLQAKEQALDPFRIDSLSLDELMSPGGAERLADELYRRLERSAR